MSLIISILFCCLGVSFSAVMIYQAKVYELTKKCILAEGYWLVGDCSLVVSDCMLEQLCAWGIFDSFQPYCYALSILSCVMYHIVSQKLCISSAAEDTRMPQNVTLYVDNAWNKLAQMLQQYCTSPAFGKRVEFTNGRREYGTHRRVVVSH